MKFGKLILRKIIKIVATISQLKCAKFDFGWASTPDHAVGAYSVPPDSEAGFKGPTSEEWLGRRVVSVLDSGLGSNRSSDAVG